jgi:TonB family protein
MTIVEALTQHLPETTAHTEPVVPPTLSPPFLEIAQNCLRLYPQRRWKLSEIGAAFQGGALSQQERVRGVSPKWRFAVPVLAVVAVLAVLFFGSKASNRKPDLEPARSVESQSSAAPPESLRVVTKPEAKVPKPGAGKGASASATARSAAPVESPNPPQPPAANVLKTEGGAGGVVHQVVPNVPESARNTITGKVRVWVRVAVDASGNVTGTTFDRPGPSQYFARLAQRSAEGWKFAPAQPDSQHVPREWVLRFEFGRESTQVFPSPAAGPAATR